MANVKFEVANVSRPLVAVGRSPKTRDDGDPGTAWKLRDQRSRGNADKLQSGTSSIRLTRGENGTNVLVPIEVQETPMPVRWEHH